MGDKITQFSLENYRNNIQLFAKGRFKPIFRNFVFFRTISEYSWSIFVFFRTISEYSWSIVE